MSSALTVAAVPVAEHGGVSRNHGADGVERLFGAPLLHETDHGIQQHHREDDCSVDPMAEQRQP